MIQVTPRMRVLVAREPLDFRTRIDGTAAACRNVLHQEPLSGTVFVFRNRSATMIRLLIYDGQGFWSATKRLSKGRFRFWCAAGDSPAEHIAAPQLQTLIFAGDFRRDTAAAQQASEKSDACEAACTSIVRASSRRFLAAHR